MSDQISTIVIKVDLGCEKCYNKIRKVLCKYHCQIQSKTFDEKNNIVIVTGWFHPCEFSKKLRCKAGKTIISIEIMKKKEPEPEKPPAPAPQPDPPAPSPEPTPAPPPPEPVKEDPPPEPEPTPAPAPAPPEPQPHKIIVPYFVPGYPPWYEGYGEAPCYEGYGMPVVPVPPPYQFPSKPPIYHEPAPPPQDYDCYYGGPPPCSCGCGGYRRCATPGDYFTEENPTTCNIIYLTTMDQDVKSTP